MQCCRCTSEHSQLLHDQVGNNIISYCSWLLQYAVDAYLLHLASLDLGVDQQQNTKDWYCCVCLSSETHLIYSFPTVQTMNRMSWEVCSSKQYTRVSCFLCQLDEGLLHVISNSHTSHIYQLNLCKLVQYCLTTPVQRLAINTVSQQHFCCLYVSFLSRVFVSSTEVSTGMDQYLAEY